MESLGHEVVPFEDVVCQMWDMLKLGDRTYVTLQVSDLQTFTRRWLHLESSVSDFFCFTCPIFLVRLQYMSNLTLLWNLCPKTNLCPTTSNPHVCPGDS